MGNIHYTIETMAQTNFGMETREKTETRSSQGKTGMKASSKE